MVQEAYVGGVSTRRVEELVGALGVANLSKSEVSRICAGLDAEVDAFRSRPLDAAGYPYVSLDALYHKVREAGRVVSMATLIAIGISAAGERSVLGVEVAAAGGDEGSSWLPFLRSLNARGLSGVRLVISDAHPGLVAAVQATFLGSAWQRCRVHATRNALGLVMKGAQGMVASAIRSIFEQPDEASARAQLRRVAGRPASALRQGRRAAGGRRGRSAGALHLPGRAPPPDPLDEPAGAIEQGDPAPHRRGRHLPQPTQPAAPGRHAARRADDEWALGRNYFSAESMLLIDAPRPPEEVPAALLIAS